MAETKLNQSIGNSIVENGVRHTVIESSVKFYKVERGTDVANNLQNLNEQESKETEPSKPFSPGPGILDGNEDSGKTRQSEDSSSDQKPSKEKFEGIEQTEDELSKASQTSIGQRTAGEKSEQESYKTEQSKQSSTGPGIPDGNENSEKTGQFEDSNSDQRTLNEKSEEIKQSEDELSKQSQSSFGQRTADEKSNGKVSNF